LAFIDEQPVTATELDSAVQDRRMQLEDDCAQRTFALTWSGLEDAIAERLLQQEATRRGQTLETLLHQEVQSRVGAPSEDEIRGLYEANRDIIKVPYPQAAPFLRRQYRIDRTQALRRALADRLRQDHAIRYTLAPPDLDRMHLKVTGPTLGVPDAQVTLVLFSDFTCPYSAQARRVIKRLLQLYPQALQVIYQDFPLDAHPRARPAAEAAHCAAEQKDFWPFYDLLFEHSANLEAADLSKYAAQAGLDMAAFAKCQASDRPRNAVIQSQTQARHFGVRGTPTVFINGMRLSGILPLPMLRAFVDHELLQPQTPPGA
jgi:protein-disulfide isomerase